MALYQTNTLRALLFLAHCGRVMRLRLQHCPIKRPTTVRLASQTPFSLRLCSYKYSPFVVVLFLYLFFSPYLLLHMSLFAAIIPLLFYFHSMVALINILFWGV